MTVGVIRFYECEHQGDLNSYRGVSMEDARLLASQFNTLKKGLVEVR